MVQHLSNKTLTDEPNHDLQSKKEIFFEKKQKGRER
jgi:hypothetical protein